jgi:hypothetical protein
MWSECPVCGVTERGALVRIAGPRSAAGLACRQCAAFLIKAALQEQREEAAAPASERRAS